jgi:hypothetical protein
MAIPGAAAHAVPSNEEVRGSAKDEIQGTWKALVSSQVEMPGRVGSVRMVGVFGILKDRRARSMRSDATTPDGIRRGRGVS